MALQVADPASQPDPAEEARCRPRVAQRRMAAYKGEEYDEEESVVEPEPPAEWYWPNDIDRTPDHAQHARLAKAKRGWYGVIRPGQPPGQPLPMPAGRVPLSFKTGLKSLAQRDEEAVDQVQQARDSRCLHAAFTLLSRCFHAAFT